MLTLLPILAVVGARLLGDLFDAYFFARAIAPVASEGQLAMKRMVRELKNAQPPFSCVFPPTSVITFFAKNNELTRFWQPLLDSSTIFMDQGTFKNKVLAQHVKAGSLEFVPKPYAVGACLIVISFTISDELPDGTKFEWPLSTAVYVK